MTTAVIKILDEVDARLKKMTTTNGYQWTLLRVDRARLTPFRSTDLPAVNYWPAFDELKEKKYRIETRSLDLRIEAHTVTRDDPFTDVAFELAYATWTVLNRSTSMPQVTADWSPNLGGLLTGFELRQITPVIGEGESPWCGCLLSLAAVYKVDSYDHTITV